MDRGKLGSKYHIMIAGDGTPTVCLATAANVPDTRLFKRLFLAAFAIMARLCEVATFSSQSLFESGFHSQAARIGIGLSSA
jgi:hypothetical protein